MLQIRLRPGNPPQFHTKGFTHLSVANYKASTSDGTRILLLRITGTLAHALSGQSTQYKSSSSSNGANLLITSAARRLS